MNRRDGIYKDKKFTKSFATIGSVLQSVTDGNRQLADAVTAETLMDYWPQVAEGALAKYTQIADFKNRTLYIEATSSVWAQQLLFYKQMIIEKFKVLVPSAYIKDIKTKSTGVLRQPIAPIEIKRKEDVIDKVAQEEIKDILADIPDPNLKEKFKHVLEKDRLMRSMDQRLECPICGKRFQGMGEICINCCSEHMHKGDIVIARYLEEAPWSKYQDIIKDHGAQIDEANYHHLKEKIINKLMDRIQTMSYAYYKTRSKKLVEAIKKEIVKYVMLKTGLTPEKINDNIIANQVTMRLYKMIYGSSYGSTYANNIEPSKDLRQ